jgi:hypothetical protein
MAVSSFAYLSGTNGFIPAATGQAIAFVRDQSKFKLNQYVQMIRSPKPVVAYALLDFDEPVRVVNDANFDWPDGMPRPTNSNQMGNFRLVEVRCFRRNYGFTVGHQIIEATDVFNPKAFFNAMTLSKAMTNVTQRFVSLMETAANWGANTADANTLNNGAGTWDNASNDPSSPNYLAIKKSILTAMKNVILATNGMIQVDDLILIVSPGLAMAMSETSEIHDYMKSQEESIQVLEGKKPSVSAGWGLPTHLYGPKVVVEDSVRVTQYPYMAGTAATTNRIWTKSDTSAVICTRVGGIDGNYGSPSASTFQRYFYKYEMAVEAFDKPEDKLFQGNVVDQFQEILSSNRSGYLITNTI